MRILVTGATGFVASHLLPAMVSDGHEVYALGHDRDRVPESGAVVLERDLRDDTAFDALPELDAVVYLAQANVPFPQGAGDLLAVNTVAPARLAEHLLQHGGTRFVYASSASVYGLGERPWSEADTPMAKDFYSATKRSSEQLLGAYDGLLAVISMRLVAPYGPGQQQRLIPRLVENVRAGRPIELRSGGRPRMNPIFVADVVEVIRALLASDTSGVLNVAGDQAVSIRELSEEIGRALGVDPQFVDSQESASGGDLVCDNSFMHAVLGEHPLTSLPQGLAALLKLADPTHA